MTDIEEMSIQQPESNEITMVCNNREMLKLCDNGDIYVKGVLCENNKEIVQTAQEFFMFVNVEITHCVKCAKIRNKANRLRLAEVDK